MRSPTRTAAGNAPKLPRVQSGRRPHIPEATPRAHVAVRPLKAGDFSFKFRAGVPCLLLVETLGEWTGRRYERVRNEGLWHSWLRKMKLPVPQLPVGEEGLADMRVLRAAIYETAQAIRGQRTPQHDAIAQINAWACHTPLPRLLDGTGTALEPLAEVSNAHVLALLARDAIALFSSEARSRIKECASPTCPVMFLDRSRRGDRIWCSPTCGARLASARYRRRLFPVPEEEVA